LLFGWLFYIIFAKLKPFGIDLDDVNQSPIAIGVFMFSFEVFLGLIMMGSLIVPLA
jgi:succinate-acetate transporter protein